MHYWWCAFLFRICLPCVIAVAVFLRPTISSYVYLVLGCYMPFFSVPTSKTVAGSTGWYLKLLLTTCILSCIMVFSFYFALFFNTDEEYGIFFCSPLEVLVRTLGVTDYKGLPFFDAIAWILPDPLMLVTSVGLFLIFKKITKPGLLIDTTAVQVRIELNRKKFLHIMLNISKYIICLMMCVTAILKATAFGAIYYVVFLGVLTYWAFYHSLGKAYARILVCLIPVMFLNITIMFFYQFQYFQDSSTFTTTSLWGRLFNLVDLKTYKDCNDPRLFKFHAQSKANYALPICLFFLYQLSILVSRQILEAKDGIVNLGVAFCHFEFKNNAMSRWNAAIKYVQRKIEKEKLKKFETHNLQADQTKMYLDQIFQFIVRTSHIVANFLMMVWAIQCIGWPGLFLLILSNVIWLVPAQRKVMLWMSPLLVVLMLFLLLRTYLYSIDLTRDELPSKFGIVDLTSGMENAGEYKWSDMLLRSLCGILIFVAMRQLMQERAMKRRQKELEEFPDVIVSETEIDQKKSDHSQIETLQKACLRFFAIYWIWIVIIVMIWMDFTLTSNLFRIAFVALAMLFLGSFQILPFNFWKKFIWFYWWLVLAYATFNLIVIYMYQLPETRHFLFSYVSKSNFERYGFIVWKDMKQGSYELSKPLFFQIAVVIQKTYLQKEFNRLTSVATKEELAEEEKRLQQKGPKMRKVITACNKARNIIFEVLEVHLMKGILLVGWFMCVDDVCAIFAVFVLLFTAAAVLGRRAIRFIVYFTSHILQVLIVLKLLYMNQCTEHDKWDFVGYYTKEGEHFNVTLNAADWVGFHESSWGRDYADFRQLVWSFFFIFLVAIHRTVVIRMRQYRLSRNLKKETDLVLFPTITSENCYDSTENLLMYLANYGFYRFGCEITLICISIVMANRLDAFAIVWSILLLIMFALSRVAMKRLWLPVLIFLALSIPVQYLTTLGLWPSLFYESKSDYWSSTHLLLMVQQFCHIMNMAQPPKKEKITWDFILFVLMSRQWLAFRKEWATRGQNSPAGNNEDVSRLIDDANVKNPVPDFDTYTRNFLDSYKRVLFRLWFYFAIGSLFMTGVKIPTIYSFGYVIGSFMFFWEGTELYLRPPKTILRRWNLLITYNVSVMVLKCVSQIFGCVLKFHTGVLLNCKVIQLLLIGCKDKYDMSEGVSEEARVPTCEVNYADLGLTWDCVCFFLLIWQQRIFKSYHFFHLVNSAKAQIILADRGAMLIEQDMKEKREKIDNDRNIIENNMKRKLQKIKANYAKIEAIRAGEYQLFDQVEKEIDIPLLPPEDEDDEDSEYDAYDPMPLHEYLGVFITTDIKTVVEINEIRRRRKKAYIREQLGKPPKNTPAKSAASKGPSIDGDSKIRKVLDVLSFSWGLFQSCIVSVTMMINRRTKNFRRILNEILKERRTLNEKTDYVKGVRVGSSKVWQPSRSYRNILGEPRKEDKEKGIQYTIYIKLLRALWYLFLTYSEWLCYIVVITNQAVECSLITLPLSLMTFCWGALTVPKPTRTFWVVCIAHLLIMVFIQNLFNMDLMPWTATSTVEDVLYPPGILGLRSRTRELNFILLLPFFLHRVVLQSLGLWKTVTYRTSSIIEDGDYKLADNKLLPVDSNIDKSSEILVVKSAKVSLGDYFPNSFMHGLRKYAEKFCLFIQQLTTPSLTQIPVDVYLPMFLCDLCNLFLLLFFFGDFQGWEGDTGLIQFVSSNRVPITFLVIVLGYVFFMMIDRGLYLKRNRFGKLIFHFAQVIGFHMWFFILHPMSAQRLVRHSPVVKAFYILKCIYFLFSAYQIRSGYPNLISSHFLWHGYTIFHRIGYKIYRKIPYFLEVRCLQDWICCDSCLGLPAWFKLEDVTQHLFTEKCQQKYEEKWGSRAGQAQNRWLKYAQGGIILTILIVLVIFPFLLFSLSSAMGVTTRPKKIKLDVYMGSAEPIFQSYAPETHVLTLTKEEYRNLSASFNSIEKSEVILQLFDHEDVVAVRWSGHSLTSWDISSGSKEELLEELRDARDFMVRVEIEYMHIGHGGKKSQRTFGQSSTIPPLPNIQRQNLIDMIESENDTNTVILFPLVLPKFLMIKKESQPEALSLMENIEEVHDHVELFASEEDDDADLPPHPNRLRNILVTLRWSGTFWWQIQEHCPPEDDNYFYYLKGLPYNTCDGIVVYIFNEKVFSAALEFMTKSGILGLYVIYFMMIIKFMRAFVAKISKLWIETLPNPDKVLRKCMEVYVARDMRNYELEREIFDEIICIMRSRELLIKLTRFEDNNYDPTFIIPAAAKK